MNSNAGSRTVTPSGMSDGLMDILKKFDRVSLKNGDRVMKGAVLAMFGAVIEATPEGDHDPEHAGTLKGGWIVTRGNPSSSKPSRMMRGRTRESIKTLISDKIVSNKIRMFLTNNHEYVNVVEYGGYPKEVKLGSWNKTLGRYEKRSAGGFSKQAPKGMVRRNTKRFKRILDIAANDVFKGV